MALAVLADAAVRPEATLAPVPLSAAYDDRLRRVSVLFSSDAAGGWFLGIDHRHVLVLANPDEPLRVIGGGSTREAPPTVADSFLEKITPPITTTSATAAIA